MKLDEYSNSEIVQLLGERYKEKGFNTMPDAQKMEFVERLMIMDRVWTSL